MGLHKVGFAKEITGTGQATHPNQTACHIEQHESGRCHGCHARNKGNKCADKRHKARQHNGDATIGFVKVVGFVKSGSVKKPRVFPLKNLGSKVPANPVIQLIPGNGRHNQQAHDPRKA